MITTIPAPSFTSTREEWPDAEFELPEGDTIPSPADPDGDSDKEDWDAEFELAPREKLALPIRTRTASAPQGLHIIRPPAAHPVSEDFDDDDEGISTIKVSALPPKPTPTAPDEDFEDAFALPSDLTQLSLRPHSIQHRSSKASFEWGDKEHTSSSTTSSDAFSSLGFNVETSSSSATSTSGSAPVTDEEGEEDYLDGLVIPPGLFESEQGQKHLKKVLEMKQKMPRVDENAKVSIPNPEDDFENGIVIDNDVDLSPSRLLKNHRLRRVGTLGIRSKSEPTRSQASAPPPRPLSRLNRSRTPVNPPPSYFNSTNKKVFPTTLSPPLKPSTPGPPQSSSSQASSSLAVPKSSSLRGQKSHSGLKSPTPPSTQRKLGRKASLSSLIEANQPRPSTSNYDNPVQVSGYNAPTAASRARMHTHSTSRVPSLEHGTPSRPLTPSLVLQPVRVTMPSSLSKTKSRPALSAVFPNPISRDPSCPSPSSVSPPPNIVVSSSTKILRRSKRRVYGDGTELDGIDDLPTDRDKEARFRVPPKSIQNRIPGGSYSQAVKDGVIGTLRRKTALTDSNQDHPQQPYPPLPMPSKTKHRRLDPPLSIRHRKPVTSTPPQGKRKPTLIRHLGGAGAPKVIGDMKWNPQLMRWDGNDHVLRDFDSAVGTSSRPALITHLTGSSIGSPVGSFGSAARVVGNMMFDPIRMCWMSTLPPDQEEPDVFADMADDEHDEDSWEAKGGTIRASQQALATPNNSTSSSISIPRTETPSSTCSRHRPSLSESGSERGSRASMICNVDDQFFENCRKVEVRHRVEMRGWVQPRDSPSSNQDRSNLYEIRALATRQY